MAITVPLFYLGVKHLRGGQQLPFVGKTLSVQHGAEAWRTLSILHLMDLTFQSLHHTHK